jgi:uncharacterized lipoprotein YmbA
MTRSRLFPARAVALCASLLLGACASAPLHYYTLVPPAEATAEGAVAPFQFELLPVGVPPQVDQPQLVVRQGGQGVAMLDSERWIAPLGDEIRGALSADLAHALGTADATGLPSSGKPLLRVKLDVRRFDSQPGSYALIEAAWSLRMLNAADGQAVLACTSRVSEPVGAGYGALVEGHQRALARLAAQVAVAARSIAAGQPAACPVE